MPDDRDRVATAVAELYVTAPEAFTGRRGELVASAREAGDRAAAKAIAGLRRPTRAAWAVNQLARTDPSAPRKLAELAAALSAAQLAGHGPRLRELSAARGALVDALTVQALSLAGIGDAPSALREEVSGTLTAAVADPAVAREFAAGTLTKAAQWSGFGVLPAAGAEAGEAEAREAESGEAGFPGAEQPVAQAAGARTAVRVPAARVPRGRAPLKAVGGETSARAAARAGAEEAAARRRQEEEERAARAAAERAARRREQYADAERAVAAASAAATEAAAAEDQLETEVRQLEQRLTEARSELAAARMRARHAEAAQRRARLAFERLPGEPIAGP